MIPVEHLEYAIRRLPGHHLVECDIYKIAIKPPINTRVNVNGGAPADQVAFKILIFVKTKNSWALDGTEGY